MSKQELAGQVVEMTVRAAPPVAVTGVTLYGYTLPDIVAILTILYLVVNTGYIFTKWIKGR